MEIFLVRLGEPAALFRFDKNDARRPRLRATRVFFLNKNIPAGGCQT